MFSVMADDGHEILDWARRCHESFQKLLSTQVSHDGIGTHYRTARDYSQRFELWAGFIGVFADGSASLDYRLRFYPEVRDLVLKMLKLLERNLSHGFWLDLASKKGIDKEASPIILSEISNTLAAVAALDAIQEAIDRLRRLAVLIRKSPSFSLTSRFETFAREVDPAKTEEFQRITSLFVTGRLPAIDSSLATQLVSSISFRRLRLLYQSKHNGKLKDRRTLATLVPSQPDAEMRMREEDPVPIQECLSRSDISKTETMPARPLRQLAVSETENSGLNLEKSQQYNDGSVDVSDTSTVTSITQRYPYPPQPRPKNGDRYCACDWCLDEINISNLDTPGWWRAHFKKDLQPYVCISEDCSGPAVYFTSFSKWRKHMDDVHTTDWARKIHCPKVWYCDVSPHEYLEFKGKEELEHHLRNEHTNDLSSKQLERRLARNFLPAPRQAGTCPLCNQDISKIYEVQESLFSEDRAALPMALNETGRSNKGSRVRFHDLEDTSSSDGETSEDLADDLSSLNSEEIRKLDLGKVSKHIARHLKSLSFLSIRYLDCDAVAGEGDSGKAASGADDAGIESSNRADKATERILDDFPEAADGKLEFEDIQTEDLRGYEDERPTPPKEEIGINNSFEEKKLQDQEFMADHNLSKKEEECRELFGDKTDNKYEWYKDRVETRAEGTCQWFLRHKHFEKWLKQDSGILLVTADPGCGKSVLAKYLIDEALPRSAAICYFFFKDQDQNTLHQALCALLHQLFYYKPSLARHAVSEYAEDGQGLTKSRASLWAIFEKATRDPATGPLVIVLDAIDECDEWDVEFLVQMLEQLGRSRMKFLLTSRPYAISSICGNSSTYANSSTYDHIMTKFRELTCTHIPGEEKSNTITEEVHRLIKCRIERLATDRELPKQIKDGLAEKLLNISHPGYLWVYLVFEYLKTANLQVTPEEAATAIAWLPENINEAYEQMLNRSSDRSMIRKALSILMAARRPLTLLEMNVAMNINERFKVSIANFKSRFETSFGLFVSFRRSRVDFFHHTARTFLLAESSLPEIVPSGLLWRHSITVRYTHTVLAKLCVICLNLLNYDDALSGTRKHKEVSWPVYSRTFVNYSAQNWVAHFQEIGTDNSSISALAIKICNPDSKAYLAWSRIVEAQCSYKLLLWAAMKGLDALLRLLLKRVTSLERIDLDGRTPLLCAAQNGHAATVQLLLNQGANIESKDNSGRTPLSWAAENGYVAVVQLLLGRGAHVDAEDNWGSTPLLRAETWDVVRLLRSSRL
ncbi:hypothetical protein EV127DRAFT_439039 [Xylaria flabelliformis]|nr:hypothetical protein EV127DRAFT_439039 [Xylaria flabelliformis]